MTAMVNGSGLHIYRSVRLDHQLSNVLFETDFLVCHISDDAILGIKFLSLQDWSVACDKELLIMAGKDFQCTDKISRLLANKVQGMQTLALPPDREVHIRCRLNSDHSGLVAFIESFLSKEKPVAVAATLERLRPSGR